MKCFQKIEEQETLYNSFYQSSYILILKPEKNTARNENYRPITHMNIYSKILANGIQQYIRIIYTMTKWTLFLDISTVQNSESHSVVSDCL